MEMLPRYFVAIRAIGDENSRSLLRNAAEEEITKETKVSRN